MVKDKVVWGGIGNSSAEPSRLGCSGSRIILYCHFGKIMPFEGGLLLGITLYMGPSKEF